MACLLGEVDGSHVLFESIDMVFSEFIFLQPLDYLNIRFGCYFFHIHGHVVANYNLHIEKFFWKRKDVLEGDESNSNYLNLDGVADPFKSPVKN